MFNEPLFLEKQSPFFEQISLLCVFPFTARDGMQPRATFHVDDDSLPLVKEKYASYNRQKASILTLSYFNRKLAIQVRFFSKDKKGDIPWNIDVILRVNSANVDIQKVLLTFPFYF